MKINDSTIENILKKVEDEARVFIEKTTREKIVKHLSLELNNIINELNTYEQNKKQQNQSRVEDLIQEYITNAAKARSTKQEILFKIFTDTTGYLPSDICLVEQQIQKSSIEYKTVFFFDLKSRYVNIGVTGDKDK